jgi:hypothetical protein
MDGREMTTILRINPGEKDAINNHCDTISPFRPTVLEQSGCSFYRMNEGSYASEDPALSLFSPRNAKRNDDQTSC